MIPTQLPVVLFGKVGLGVLLGVGIVTWPIYTLCGLVGSALSKRRKMQ